MPGDEWEDTFTLVNTTASRAEFFLRTELPEELSETEKELLSKVKLEIREGDSMIYEGDLERDYGQQKVLEYAVQMNGKKSVFQSVCRQNLEMNGHFGKAG